MTFANLALILLALAHPTGSTAVIDSDGDGLPDTLEIQLGTDPLIANEFVTLSGTVFHEGIAVEGARVWVAGGVDVSFRTSTDANGGFRFPGWPATLLPRTVFAKTTLPGSGILFGEAVIQSSQALAPPVSARTLRQWIRPRAVACEPADREAHRR